MVKVFFCYLAHLFRIDFREVAEWSKAHAWKVCIPHKGIEGSNPFLSANYFFKINIFISLTL